MRDLLGQEGATETVALLDRARSRGISGRRRATHHLLLPALSRPAASSHRMSPGSGERVRRIHSSRARAMMVSDGACHTVWSPCLPSGWCRLGHRSPVRTWWSQVSAPYVARHPRPSAGRCIGRALTVTRNRLVVRRGTRTTGVRSGRRFAERRPGGVQRRGAPRRQTPTSRRGLHARPRRARRPARRSPVAARSPAQSARLPSCLSPGLGIPSARLLVAPWSTASPTMM
jgi:hypothetical protein